jgi:hypothetical protein
MGRCVFNVCLRNYTRRIIRVQKCKVRIRINDFAACAVKRAEKKQWS